MTHSRRNRAVLTGLAVPIVAITALVSAGCGTSATESTTASSSATSSSAAPSNTPTADDAEATTQATQLSQKVSSATAFSYLQSLEAIATRNGNNRALGTPGYLQSVEFVEKTLTDAGFTPRRQEFTVTKFTSDRVVATVNGATVPSEVVSGSGSSAGVLSAPIFIAPNRGGGCGPTDLDAFPEGAIAVFYRGTCPFKEMYEKAAAKGAAGLVVVNKEPGLFQGTLGDNAKATIPVVAVGPESVNELTAQSTITLDVRTSFADAKTWNVLAETTTGATDRKLVVGAHLDSVPEGPGINDNGTGVAAVLQTAVALGSSPSVKNQVQFAFWGAEEEGLLGSQHYISELSDADRATISRYLNFDMLGSPNYGFFTYDGDGSSKLDGGAGPPGSGVIEQVFRNYFATKKVTVEASAFDGRSDYGGFIEVGIPAGGVDTGADGKKTPEQVTQWGGTPGIIYDPNYHTARDTVANVNRPAYDVTVGAVGWATGYFANL